MMMPSIFGENLFDDDWMDFPFDRFDREFFGRKNPLYGKHAKNMMKTDIRDFRTQKPVVWKACKEYDENRYPGAR